MTLVRYLEPSRNIASNKEADLAVPVRLSDVKVMYSERCVLQDVSFEVEAGESYFIIGPSGSGKTTLLKTINGLVAPSEGKVTVLGVEVNGHDHLSALRKKIGYIPQNLGLVRNLTVRENVLLGALPRTLSFFSLTKHFSDEDLDLSEDALRAVDLEDQSHKKVYSLSGGEMQRVAIARTLLQRPSILLADELVSDLDYVKAREIMDIVANERKKMNITTIMVHHDLRLISDYADSVAVLKEGRLIAELDPDLVDERLIMELFRSS